MRLRTAYVLAAVWVLLLTAGSAYAADVTVDCNKKKTINAALAGLSKQGPHTVTVSGTCNENVVIDGFDTLTLIGTAGASINDPTPGNLADNDVVDILQSRNVTVQGFTINGGIEGVACIQFSVCYLRELLVQGQSGDGVIYARSSGFVDNTTIQNTLFAGFQAVNSSNVILGSNLFGTPGTTTIQNNGTEENGGFGVNANHGSNLTLVGVTVQGHAYGDGVSANFGAFLRLLGSNTITANAGNGISISGALARIQAAGETVSITNNGGNGVNLANTSTFQSQGGTLTVTGNTGNGIRIGHLSFVRLAAGRTISGNGSPDVNCSVSTAKTEGVGDSSSPNLGGGTTNCTEPAP
ncbi:MAG TPA: right-handed parallel beta-helix repeat-containing protein [Terriglobales bacterium]|nr:right-handed parallel beta-helix repeat-containing protein [Terriglobales bacterium]